MPFKAKLPSSISPTTTIARQRQINQNTSAVITLSPLQWERAGVRENAPRLSIASGSSTLQNPTTFSHTDKHLTNSTR
ncbi:hypothetical protein [Pedosphaera parvula]|uniref:Uncharacterized protein n=1 Tax=Pedosphaera parvula (strain Ellin514) TaxID=320771 RepID=B9XFT1_PEDPL|nr:hypothetical protein [Pedosphaera parvula]EEF61445.1 hypothetical protein Cflav_PD4466 [Pedosphaera parvula Ellin514]